MRKVLQILIFSFSCILWVFGSPFFFEVEMDDQLTPFHLLKIPLEDVPVDVHFIEATIKISDDTNTFEHISHYPILKNSFGKSFSLVHFLWLIESKDLEIQEQIFHKPVKISCSYTYGHTLETHFALLQIVKDPTCNTRILTHTIQPESQPDNSPSFNKQHQKAVIFIHGILGGRYETILENYSKTLVDGWKSESLKQYWSKHYQYDNVDYFEYQFDSLFKPAIYYGEKLSKILEQSGILDSYKEIYLVSYSMGTIVARYAMNTKLSNSERFMGDLIQKAFMIGGVLEGTFFSNLTDYLITQMPLEESPELINAYENKSKPETLNTMFDIIFHLEEFAFDPNNVEFFFESFLELYRTNPLIANVIFISFDDIPFIGGQLIPFSGMTSMRYTSNDFLNELENELQFPKGTYIPNIELLRLNESERYYDKLILITSYIEDAQETLEKLINLTRYFNPQTVFTKITDKNTGILSIPYVQFIGQRALSLIMKRFGERTDDPLHSMNDGFVTLWSEQLTSHRERIKEENVFLIKNLDHAQIKDHPMVLDIVRFFIQGN